MAKRQNYEFELSFFESLHKRLPKDVRTASILAHLYTETGQIDAGLKIDRKLARLLPEDATVHYNLACSLALKGRYSDAVNALRKAVANGYEEFDWMLKDPDLSELKGYPKFEAFCEECGLC